VAYRLLNDNTASGRIETGIAYLVADRDEVIGRQGKKEQVIVAYVEVPKKQSKRLKVRIRRNVNLAVVKTVGEACPASRRVLSAPSRLISADPPTTTQCSARHWWR
jgi:hypothetical protein